MRNEFINLCWQIVRLFNHYMSQMVKDDIDIEIEYSFL